MPRSSHRSGSRSKSKDPDATEQGQHSDGSEAPDEDEIEYRSDPRGGGWGEGDYAKAPTQTLQAGAGDCEDLTILMLSLSTSLGIESYMAFTDTHAYPIICFPQRYRSVRAFRVGDSYCYDTEPTRRGATLGEKKDPAKVNAVLDPLRKEQVSVRW